MKVEFQFVGTRRDNLKEPGTQAVPRIGETVIFMEDGEEHDYMVKNVYYIYDENSVTIQVVLQS